MDIRENGENEQRERSAPALQAREVASIQAVGGFALGGGAASGGKSLFIQPEERFYLIESIGS